MEKPFLDQHLGTFLLTGSFSVVLRLPVSSLLRNPMLRICAVLMLVVNILEILSR